MADTDWDNIAKQHGVSRGVVDMLRDGLQKTGGRRVQFSHPELGGMGQWMPGMIMVGRMGDHALKAKVDALCRAIAESLGDAPTKSSSFPAFAAMPKQTTEVSATAAGSQNGVRYAYFAATNRLEIQREGESTPTTYDVTGHRITGVAQGQASGTPGTLRFTTTTGETVDLASLKRVA